MASPPKIGVFLLCDAAVQDPATGKSTLVGVFDRVFAPGFPLERTVGVTFKVKV